MQRTKSKILSILLSLVMLLSLLPTTALAAGYPYPDSVFVDGGKSFSTSQLYYKNNDVAGSFSGSDTGYNAHYDPDNGILTLKDYDGGQIKLGGDIQRDLTIKLIGDNKITVNGDVGIDVKSYECNITITAESGSSGTLTINVENEASVYDGVTGIGNYLATGGGTSGNVTITGYADVTINATSNTANYTSYGIYANKVVIEDHAKAAITVNALSNTGGDFVYGIYAKDNVTINTAGEITVDASNAGTGDRVYSTGVRSMNTLTLTRVGRMTVKWNDEVGNQGFPLSPNAEFDSNAYDNNVDKPNCIATYTPKVAATITSVSATVSQPVKGHPLDTSVNVGGATAYTADVMWKADGMTVNGNAQADTVYTALITLRAKAGEAFSSSLHNTTTPGGYSIEWLNSNELLLTKEFDRTNLKDATGIAIDNTTLTVAVPPAKPNMEQKAELPLTAKVNYDDGTDETVDAFWSIVDPKPEGVDIDKTTDKLTVTNKAANGTVEVKAAYNGMTTTATVTITKETLKPSAIVLTAPTPATVAVPKNNTPNTIALPTAAVYDQYGMPMTGPFTITYESVDTTPTGVTLVPATGKLTVERTAQAGEVKIVGKLTTAASTVTSDPVIYNITRETSQVTSVRVIDPHYYMDVPKVTEPGTTSQANQQFYAAKVLDQYGQEMTGQTVTWKVADGAGNLVTGVSIDATGNLTVTNKAPAITVYVTATCSGIVSNKSEVTLKKETEKDTFVEIFNQVYEDPETRLLIPAATFTNSEAYTAKVYDQYGKETGGMVNWALNPATVAGVELDTTTSTGNAILKVNSTATSGTTFKLKATTSTHETSGFKELEIKVQKKTDVSSKINFNDGSLTYNGAGQKYEKAALDSSVTAGDGGTWTYTYTAGTGMLDAAGLPKTVGTYTVTATYEDNLNIGSKSVTLTIEPKTVDIPAEDKMVYTYDGTEKTYNIPTSTYYTVSGNKQTNANEGGYPSPLR